MQVETIMKPKKPKIKVTSKTLQETIEISRMIGEFGDAAQGATLIFTAGVHGNEPAGVFALRKVLSQLQHLKPDLKGKIVGLAGNVGALAQSRRYIDIDLNRLWKLHGQQGTTDESIAEHKERRALYRQIKSIVLKSEAPIYLIDLHTTSSQSPPFISISDTLRDRYFALHFPAPIILGLEEQIEGTMLNFMNDRGLVTLLAETGQHDSREAIANAEAIIWSALAFTGILKPENIPDFDKHSNLLEQQSGSLKRKIFEMRAGYRIKKGEQFRMKPGYVTFQAIKKEEVLAENQHGPIKASESGYIFMPLYQKQGNDGYFVVDKVNPFWLKVSTICRKLKLDRLLPYLPGIRKHPRLPHSLTINTYIARWKVVEFIHLLGYRRDKIEAGRLTVSRRKYDFKGPDAAEFRVNFG